MSTEIILKTKVERPCDLTKREAEQKDREQPWRKRVSSGAMDHFLTLNSLIYWIKDIIDDPRMKPLYREMGVYRDARSGKALLFRAVEKAYQQISAVQLRVMDANWKERYMTLSTTRHVEGFMNVDSDALDVLIRQTIKQCRESFCMAGRKDAEQCPVYRALSNCPNMGRYMEDADTSLDVCPYALLDVKEGDAEI